MTQYDEAATARVQPQNVLQVCVVVADLQEAMRHYWEVLGIGPWQVYKLEPPELTATTLRGKPEPYSMKLAVAQIGNVQWELIQPLTGKNIYEEFLKTKGGGIHHVLVSVENYDAALQELRNRGVEVLMGGSWRGASYSYANTEKSLGTIFELVKVTDGFSMPPPDEIYPPPQ